jgi:hypothetical protein
MSNKTIGDAGEKEVIKLCKCPNCSKELMSLPNSFPLFDLQCTACNFRAQVKTISHKPSTSVLGAGWDIMEKYIKTGHLIPATIFNFKWKENGKRHQEILFYPFLFKSNLKPYQLSPTAKRANYWMFRYVNMEDIPCLILYSTEP